MYGCKMSENTFQDSVMAVWQYDTRQYKTSSNYVEYKEKDIRKWNRKPIVFM